MAYINPYMVTVPSTFTLVYVYVSKLKNFSVPFLVTLCLAQAMAPIREGLKKADLKKVTLGRTVER